MYQAFRERTFPKLALYWVKIMSFQIIKERRKGQVSFVTFLAKGNTINYQKKTAQAIISKSARAKKARIWYAFLELLLVDEDGSLSIFSADAPRFLYDRKGTTKPESNFRDKGYRIQLCCNLRRKLICVVL